MFGCDLSDGNCHAEQPYAIWRPRISSNPWGSYGNVTCSHHCKSMRCHLRANTHPLTPLKISSLLQEIYWQWIFYLVARQWSYDRRQQLGQLQDHCQWKWTEVDVRESMQEARLRGHDHPNRRREDHNRIIRQTISTIPVHSSQLLPPTWCSEGACLRPNPTNLPTLL